MPSEALGNNPLSQYVALAHKSINSFNQAHTKTQHIKTITTSENKWQSAPCAFGICRVLHLTWSTSLPCFLRVWVLLWNGHKLN